MQDLGKSFKSFYTVKKVDLFKAFHLRQTLRDTFFKSSEIFIKTFLKLTFGQ